MTSAVPILDAATVLPIRDGEGGVEVLMLRRNLESGFVPGAYVFPGGAVDPGDHLDGVDPFRVAAIRECFEEAGLLFATDASGAYPAHVPHELRHAPIQEVCRAHGLTIAPDALHPLSRWVTPDGAPRRYDTRFFVALAPTGQQPSHDGREAIAHLWIRPADALERNADGDYELIHPTLMSLRTLAEYDEAAGIVDALRRERGAHPHLG